MDLDFKNLSKEKKQWLFLISLGILVVFVLYINFLLKPTIAGLKDVSPKVSKLAFEIQRVEDWTKKKPRMQRELTKLRSEISRYEGMLPSEKEIPALLEELSQMARESHVKIIGIRPGKNVASEPGKESFYQEIPISIKAKSGYHQLGVFISKLEGADRLFAVRDIKIKSNIQTPKKHDVSLTVSSFLLLEK